MIRFKVFSENGLNLPVKKGVLAYGLDEVSEWTKRKSKHIVALDEKKRAELENQIREEKT
ncbi:hypothetical protein F511_43086 [Dorcoceras hygrometricum]|uniref:Uncharacterized protein n=1 Tax=Dorcoceras hygrometricum TaxID=472368 RepID=A0A2Z7CPX8_9LAMI|nr:hypothetical protein F511_43086 [Dorcoceras hygrometricum]